MGTVNNNISSSLENYSQWLSIDEVSLFLHDGLVRASDLIEIPEETLKNNRNTSLVTNGVGTVSNSGAAELEQVSAVIAFDTRSPKELSDRILSLCGTRNNAYVQLVAYRVNALRGLWNAQRQLAVEQEEKAESSTSTTAGDDHISLNKKQILSGLWHANDTPSFTSRLGLLLVLPLLKSQSKTDPALCATTTQLLLQCLLDCPPHSLSREPDDCLDGLEELLCDWLEGMSVSDSTEVIRDSLSVTVRDKGRLAERESVASALVALVSARGCLRSFISTLHLLHNLPDITSLPVAHILRKLLELEGGPACWASLVGNKQVICWGFEDMLPTATKKEGADKEADFGRSVTCDGKFLYTTNSAGNGLAKIGTGLGGTLRGYVYTKIADLGPGRVAWGGPGIILHRPHDFDISKEPSRLAIVINPHTLKQEEAVYIPSSVSVKSVVTTIQFCSDGFYFYWVWCPGSLGDKSIKSQTIYVDTFAVQAGQNEAIPVKKRIILQRKEDSGLKSFNETIVSLLRPYRPSAAAAANMVVLSGNLGAPYVSGQDNSGTVTSCGIPLKSLLRVPIYCCGNSMVIVTSSTSSGSSNVAARSPFGNAGTLSNLRSLATCHFYSLKDGLFVGRTDLYDAPSCSLARGTQLSGLAACYDSINNMIWTCSSEWIDQFINPGHQAAHHINRRLNIDEGSSIPVYPSDDRLSLPEVIKQLLQHVGSLCCHQTELQVVDPSSNVNQRLQQVSSKETKLFVKVLDMLEIAVRTQDPQIVCCNLVILQVICKSLKLRENAVDEKHLKRTSALLWQLLNEKPADNCSRIQMEACQVFCTALSVLYSSPEEHDWIHKYLLTDGNQVPALINLRELIMSDYAERLKQINIDASELKHLILNDGLLDLVMNVAVEESRRTLLTCFQATQDEFERMFLTLPYCSPTVRYLCSLQNYLLRQLISGKVSDGSNAVLNDNTLNEMRVLALNFSQKVLNGARKVFEILIEICESSGQEGGDCKRINSIERAVKSTILGYLIPIIVTSLSHPNLQQSASISGLIPHIIRLIILSCKIASLMKSHAQKSLQSPTPPLTKNGEDVSSYADSEKLEEMGFVDGLKIPAPWARGCIVESIHPVRDNYKMKETVHIPGARCLFLRFDSRCSSQYDYDKLLVYAGPDTNGHKAAEYGGNTFGYGSRSVLGGGWPKDLVKVEGDTVTFAFEMRSGREHNTPDKAMWGFLVTVRAQESMENLANGLPFVTDLALGLTVLASDILQLLYKGPALAPEEINSDILLKSRFMQRCVCNIESEVLNNSTADLSIDENSELNAVSNTSSMSGFKTNLSTDFLHKLRQISGCFAPQLRPSIRSALHVDRMEDRIMLAVLKHAHLPTNTNDFLKFQEQPECRQKFVNIISQSYRKLDALIRRLQALAELEQRWQSEVEDIRQGMMPANMAFFADYHFSESKTKELSMLCFLKGVDMEGSSAEVVVHKLREKLESEAYAKEGSNNVTVLPFAKTRQLVATILQRAEILLMVTLEGSDKIASVTSEDESGDANSLGKPAYSRSFSAPCQASDVSLDKTPINEHNFTQLPKNKRFSGLWGRYSTSILGDIPSYDDDSPIMHVQSPSLLDQLFAILSCQPEKNISPKEFKAATEIRKSRGISRRQSLVYMKELLTAALGVDGATHLPAAVTSVLQEGPKSDELTCSGMISPVREAFADTVASVVKLASRYPLACSNSIGLLCVIPYSKSEERCLVNSGLVQLLDWMCSLSDHRSNTSSDPKNLRQRVAAMAWAGFQVLSNCCVTWEKDDDVYEDEYLLMDNSDHSGQSGLAQQVATLLTNHLARATDNSCDDAGGNEALQEVLSLLNNLSKSQMGKAILSQPTCVSKLLSLLLDQRPSPKLILIILQLCRSALPLMNAEDCRKVILPAWGNNSKWDNSTADYIPVHIASLLLTKLADFVIPGFPMTAALEPSTLHEAATSTRRLTESSTTEASCKDLVKLDDCEPQDGRLSVFLYKREDQSAHEVSHPLFSADNRLYRLSGSGNSERMERITRELNKFGRSEVCTEDAVSALRRAAKWAQSGMVVSTGPIEKDTHEGNVDRRKMTTDSICKEKNIELAKNDPLRLFISGQVANSMASEVIGLLHELLMADTAAKIWASSVRNVLGDALSCLPQIVKQMEIIGVPLGNVAVLLQSARRLLATLCALGGFKSSLKVGSEALITSVSNDDACQTYGVVVALDEQHGLATIKINTEKTGNYCSQGNDTCQVPLSRLVPIQCKQLPLDELGLTDQVIRALHSFLLNESERKPLPTVSYGSDDNLLPMTIARIGAEIRTRAFMVLSLYLKNKPFSQQFLCHSLRAVEIVKQISMDCLPSDRTQSTESRCERLRMLFRDCAKPPLPPIKSPVSKPKEITWNTTRGFPPVRASLFSHGLTGITYLGEPGSSPQGMPRGTFIYASQGIPLQATSFYWEIEICSLGEVLDDNSNGFSLGLAPLPERKETPWVNQIGTVILHNGGRAVHYCGSSLLTWKSVKLAAEFAAGDIVGCGWERTEHLPDLLGRPAKGHVFFTYNGLRLTPYIEDVVGGMYPVVHLQTKGARIKSNFGTRPFAYAEGLHHVTSAHEALESTEEISATFGLLPFPCSSDSEGELSDKAGPINDASIDSTGSSAGSTDKGSKSISNASTSSCKVSTTIDRTRDYDYEASSHAHLAPCYSNLLTTGPEPFPVTGLVEGEDSTSEEQLQQLMEDQYALLVKAWEIKVFPVIRRRFRNEGERKDGLEQIKGALSLGMTDIARQTVEYLYEENGGIPRDLHLPTIEDIKEDMSRISLDRLKKGQEVLIRNAVANSVANTGVTVLPKFAVPGMLKTFGLLAVVLDIEQHTELVQLEIYLRSEGVLVRYWYPIEVLERPPTGINRSSANTSNQMIDTNNTAVHRELIYWENALSRVYCRISFLELAEAVKSSSVADEVTRLQLISDHRQISSCFNGTIFDHSLCTSVSSRQALKSDTCCISDLFYADEMYMKSELRKTVAEAFGEEDRLLELTNRITSCLQPDQRDAIYRCEQVQMLSSKSVTDIHMPEAAYIVVFGKVDPEKNSPKNNAYCCSKPWGRVFYYSGQDFKRYSSSTRQEVACYPYGPLATQSGASNSVSGNSPFYPFPTVMLSCDRVHLRVGGYGCADVYLMVNSIPANFPLALTFIEVILRWTWQSSSTRQTFTVIARIVDILCNFIGKVDLPIRLKECVFHLLAEALRCLLNAEEDLSTVDYPALSLLSFLQMELKLLHNEESRHYVSYWLDRSTKGGTFDRSIRFSSYFHSLMEVCLAMAEIANHSSSRPFRNAGAATLGLYGICVTAMALNSNSAGSGVVGNQLSGCGAAPPSPSAGSKRKKMKAKRDRDRASPKSRSGSSSPRSSVCENEPQASTSANISTTVGTAKAEELLWFHRAVNACEILRVIVDGKKKKSPGPLDDAISDSLQTLTTNTGFERLLIITGIPTHLSENIVKRAIEKALRSVGGPQRGEIFVASSYMKVEQPSTHSISTLDVFTSDKPIHGFAVVEIKVKAKMEAAKKALFRCKGLLDGGSLELGLMTEEVIDLVDNNISISTVKENLQLSDPDDNYAFETYLKYLLYGDNGFSQLREDAVGVLTDIFHSCFITDQHLAVRDIKEESGFICLSKEQITNHAQGNLLHAFFNAMHPAKKSISDSISSLLQSYGFSKKENKESPTNEKPLADKPKPKKSSMKKSHKEKFVFMCRNDSECEKSDNKDKKSNLEKNLKSDNQMEERFYLTLDGFLRYVGEKGQKDVQGAWRGLLACGYDFHYDRTCCIDLNQAQHMASQWTLEMDCALVKHVDSLCRKFVISPSQLHPQEVYLSASDLTSHENVCLQGLSVESLRLRTAFLQSLNNTLENHFLPFVDLRLAEGYSHSIVRLLSRGRGIVFHDTKMVLMNYVLNITALRRADQAAPEIVLDLLEVIGSEIQEMSNTQFCQAMRKLSEIPSSQFCVQLASGGDPTYSFNVRYVGEEVHGTSGSFRHFLSQVSRELQSSALPLLVPCPSAAANRNKGKYILQPGVLRFSDEKMLQFFGQLLGISIRAGIPLPIDLVPAFWKQLVGVPLDPITDLMDVDILTCNYIKEFDLVENARDLSQLLEEHHNPHFVYTNLNGDKVELCSDGQNIPVSWENHLDYVEAIRSLRMKELASPDRYLAIKAGLASLIPIQLLNLLTPLDLELRTCGVPYVDLDFLKNHTMYQVGLTETDPHIRFFWNALESLSQEELRKFIKFACNQERIPSSCPCKDGHQDTVHVPPYPMKIAPPEGRTGTPDSRYIRAETCMFMLKLPQYSAQEIMTERLLYAINCRDDPLSG
ncbi:putative E3 ubiquitin-protein ligase HTD4 [Chamberlinius hualienensis]